MNYKKILLLIKDDLNAGLEALFNSYSDSFYGYAVECWNFSEDEAWEVVYQTFDKLLSRLPECEFTNQSQFDAYLFRVLKSYLSKSYRKKKNRKSKLNVISIEDTADSMIISDHLQSCSFDETFVNKYLEEEEKEHPQMEALKKALSELEEFDRTILLLRAQNLSYDEIADLLQIENKQLKVKHHRAKQRLIKILETSQTFN